MIALLLFLCPLVFVIAPSQGSRCYDTSRTSSQGYSFDCGNGCCGTTFRQYCCMADGAVAGIVIGSVFAMTIFAVMIILGIRYYTHRTVIISPVVVPAATVAVVAHGTHASMYPTQTYPPGVYPSTAYSNPAVAPPPYSKPPTPAITKGSLATPQS